MSRYKRYRPALRKQMILSVALNLAVRRKYNLLTRSEVSHAGGFAPALINVYFPRMEDLRDAVMHEAVRVHNVPVVAQGLGMQHPAAQDAPDELKSEAARWMVRGDSR